MNLPRKFVAAAAAAALLAQLAGCSAFRARKQTVRIDCAQEGVQLKVNNLSLACPTVVPVERNQPVNVLASKEGYPTQQRTVKFHINTTGALDLAGGLICLLPAIGLAFPGAFTLDTTELYVDLRRPPESAANP